MGTRSRSSMNTSLQLVALIRVEWHVIAVELLREHLEFHAAGSDARYSLAACAFSAPIRSAIAASFSR